MLKFGRQDFCFPLVTSRITNIWSTGKYACWIANTVHVWSVHLCQAWMSPGTWGGPQPSSAPTNSDTERKWLCSTGSGWGSSFWFGEYHLNPLPNTIWLFLNTLQWSYHASALCWRDWKKVCKTSHMHCASPDRVLRPEGYWLSAKGASDSMTRAIINIMTINDSIYFCPFTPGEKKADFHARLYLSCSYLAYSKGLICKNLAKIIKAARKSNEMQVCSGKES